MTAVPDLDRRLLRLVPTPPVVAALLEDVVILAEGDPQPGVDGARGAATP
jgi:hypothetical protein